MMFINKRKKIIITLTPLIILLLEALPTATVLKFAAFDEKIKYNYSYFSYFSLVPFLKTYKTL